MSSGVMFVLFCSMLPLVLFLAFLFAGATDRKGETEDQKKERQADTVELATGCFSLLVVGCIIGFLVIVISIALY